MSIRLSLRFGRGFLCGGRVLEDSKANRALGCLWGLAVSGCKHNFQPWCVNLLPIFSKTICSLRAGTLNENASKKRGYNF